MNHHPQERKKHQRKPPAKENLINNIKNETFCKIGISNIAGVGVIAIKDIPKGTEVFKCCNEELFGSDKPMEIHNNELVGVETSILEYINNFMVSSGPNLRPLPFRGLNSMNIIFYLNHSDSPNTGFSTSGDDYDFVKFVTIKNIKKGEELTEDYNNLSNNKVELYKQFPFLHDKK